jgi:hypothetical protein
LSLDWTSWERVEQDVNELSELVSEIRNHYQLLTNLIESVCIRASVEVNSTDYRAIRRYLIESDQHLMTVGHGLRRLTRHPELNGVLTRRFLMP